jgi:hypothetical protein
MKKLIIIAFLSLFSINTVRATPVLIDEFPSYNWINGCTPSAAMMIMGYWDLNGYNNLTSAEGWDQIRETENILSEMELMAHYLETGKFGLRPGYTYIHKIPSGIEKYTAHFGYNFNARHQPLNFEILTNEINNSRPVKLTVKSSSGLHGVSAFGYEWINDTLRIATHNTWHETEQIDWYSWLDVKYLTTITPKTIFEPNPVPQTNTLPIPEPSTIFITLIGIFCLGILAQKEIKIL